MVWVKSGMYGLIYESFKAVPEKPTAREEHVLHGNDHHRLNGARKVIGHSERTLVEH